MLDGRLVGYWSDKNLYLGDMVAADIAFCSDGTGWTYWSNAAGGFDRQVIHGVLGERFAFERELAAGEHDPAYGTQVPPGTT